MVTKRTAVEATKGSTPIGHRSTQSSGEAAEARALRHLLQHGLALVARNYRIARGPSSAGGEIDLIMRDADETIVFVEVRARRDARYGGAAASIGSAKRRRLIFAAHHFLRHRSAPPPCRFDVVAIEGDRIDWLRGAFDAA